MSATTAWYGPEEEAARNAEYLAATTAAAVCDLGERTVLAVSGPPRAKFLHNVLSNDVQSLVPGQGRRAALMDVKGRQLCWMRVLAEEDALLLELPTDRLAVVERTLAHYRVAAPVRFAERPAGVVAILGPRAEALLTELGLPAAALAAPESHARGALAGGEARVVRAGDLPGGGFVLHLEREAAEAGWNALAHAGARPMGRHALDALRIEHGRPWYGFDVGEENLLHETGLVHEYHSPTKGCYVGQEVVARLEGRGGNVNRALRGLRLTAPARTGDPITAEGADAGQVTTAAVSPPQGPLAMGYVHRRRFEAGATVEVAGRPATVALLPLRPAAG